ncbi:hypothetical protein [Dinghuibacter silviterrae]|uniref:Uncharacterized protein n=1 Tax=Dinghuibacter silviterrae TaxID=1539049 RepID=A0A4R8DV22_9BACT|nr:hypothetical protein [Dinghuibacter silviterrae]TDX02260.1 hypothetical protein EDB95_3315 [Dinghuibacter silviterrae]
MKFLISFILILLLSLGAQIYLPFWSVAIVAFVVSALIPQTPWKALLCGFAAVFVLWAGLALYLDEANDHLLANRISLLVLKMSSPLLLIAVTGFVGGLVGAMGALSGSFLHRQRTAA